MLGYNGDSGAFPGYGGVTYPTYPGYGSTSMQFSFGGILKDFGSWIVTTAGEVLRTAIDAFGRRVVEKTGVVLAPTPVGSSTAGVMYYCPPWETEPGITTAVAIPSTSAEVAATTFAGMSVPAWVLLVLFGAFILKPERRRG